MRPGGGVGERAGCARPGTGLGDREGVGSGVRGAHAQNLGWEPVRGWGMGSRMRAQEWAWGAVRGGAGAAGARAAAAPGGDQAGSAQSARRPRSHSPPASRGAAGRGRGEAGGRPGSGCSVRAGAQAPRGPRWAGGAKLQEAQEEMRPGGAEPLPQPPRAPGSRTWRPPRPPPRPTPAPGRRGGAS